MIFEEDTPEQILQCLECRYPKCVNCLDRRNRKSRCKEKTPKPLSFDTEMAETMYRGGMNDIEISAKLHVSRQKIGRWRRNCGLEPVSRL